MSLQADKTLKIKFGHLHFHINVYISQLLSLFTLLKRGERHFLYLTGSNIKPLTPLPVDMTIIVADPYKAYPAATIWLPGCKASDTVGTPSVLFLKEIYQSSKIILVIILAT